MNRQPGVHPYIEDDNLVMKPISSEFITVFRKRSTGVWYSKRYDGTIEPFDNDVPGAPVSYRKILKVDDMFGNDTDASLDKYNISICFKTPEAAQSAAEAGDLIVVDPGTYNLSFPLGKDGVDWFLHNNVTLSSDTSVFEPIEMNFNVGGYGNLIGNGAVSPVLFLQNGSKCIMQFNNITHNNVFYNGAHLNSECELELTVYGVIDCSFNLSDSFYAAGNSKLVVNCPEVRFSRIGVSCTDGSTVILNVDRFIAYDFAGDPTSYATSYVVTGGDGNNVTVNGNLENAKTVFPDPVNSFSAAINCFGTNSVVTYNGSVSNVQGYKIVKTLNSTSTVNINGDITSNDGDGIYTEDCNEININGRIKVPNTPVICGIGPGGRVILRNAILVSDNLNPSIDGTACTGVFKFNNYYGVANTPVSNANEIVGIALIDSPNVQ